MFKFQFIFLLPFFLFQFFLQSVKAEDIETMNQNDSANFRNKRKIRVIEINGNLKTKKHIILNEIPIKLGSEIILKDSLNYDTLITNQLINTSLFLVVKTHFHIYDSQFVDLEIEVKERWYLFPLPYLSLIDRNFTTFLIEEKAAIYRINYGLKINYNNLTGQNDKLIIWLINGFSPQLAFKYQLPFLNHRLKTGLAFEYRYSQQNELNIYTKNNKQFFLRLPQIAQINNSLHFTIQKRLDPYKYLFYNFTYVSQRISDSILSINKNYFPTSSKIYNFIENSLTAQYIKIDYIPFPMKGLQIKSTLSLRQALKVKPYYQFQLSAVWAKKFNNKFFFNQRLWSNTKFNNTSAYITQPLIGYADNQPRALDLYVVDGDLGVTLKNSLYYQFFKWKLKSVIHPKKLHFIPLNFYTHIFFDGGYSVNKNYRDPTNTLINKWLWTTGLGIDLVTIYDFVLNFDYGFNQIGKKALYLRFKFGF